MFTDPSKAETSALLARAERYRKLAGNITDHQTAKVLLEMAQEYDDLAAQRLEAPAH